MDFLVQNGSHVFALEAKAEENLRSKNLRSFKEAHREVDAVRLSISGYRKQNWMRNVPLYAMSNLELWSR